MEPLIVFDQKKCIGCLSCGIACQLENDAPPGLQLRHVQEHIDGTLPDSRIHFISTACFHCPDPSCVAACPAGALYRRADGVVEHLRNKCIGCGYCIHGCPFHVPQFSPTQHVMRKCNFCIQRIDCGKKPACASKCTTGALSYFPDGQQAGGTGLYGKKERLQMVYNLEGDPKNYRLPDPVPLNVVASKQVWNWLMGLVPGSLLLAWLWKKAEEREKDNA
jgi:anaerobic dimethyl sulfoxide reductase subunit B (iron-sulfur subunit)